MKSLVLESPKKLSLRNLVINETLGDDDVRVKIQSCGICGSDLHYYQEGRIGNFIVKEPMILGHEASGYIVEKGKKVTGLEIGDLVCMEPGIPSSESEEVLRGFYNLDPNVSFWATPPVHGCMRESVIHPARFCFKLPSNVTAEEGAMMEPLSVAIESVKKAKIVVGDIGLVIGAGPIGILTAITAIAGGCSKVILCDIISEKLEIASHYDGIIAVNSSKESLDEFVKKETNGKGVDILFESAGSHQVYSSMFSYCRTGARAVLIGMMNQHPSIDIVQLQVLGISIESVFRYTNTFDRAVLLVSSGKIDIKPLISKRFNFEDSIEAYEFASKGYSNIIKVMINFPK